MRTTESVVVPAPAAAVYRFVADLSAYPSWLPLVHDASPSSGAADAATHPAWDVEIRARVGPFARSKRLRMQRIHAEEGRLAVFERAEVDGRDHARWALRVELDDTGEPATPGAPSTTVTMHLAYDGGLWTGGVLEAVLDDQVRRGRVGLAALVSSDATR